MARNPNVMKMNRQRFRRRRGNFKARSEQSSLDDQFNSAKLSKFWAERVSPRSGGPTKSVIPDQYAGICDYRQRGASVEEAWLDARFPGVQMKSAERQKCLDLAKAIAHEPEMHVVIMRTRLTILRLCFIASKDCWWFEEQTNLVVKKSITYGSKKRALEVLRMQSVDYPVYRTFPIPSS